MDQQGPADKHKMAEVGGDSANAAPEVSAEALLEAIKDVKQENPDFGIKRVWTTLKEKGMEVSEKRVKKFMQEHGLTESSGGSEAAAEGGDGTEMTSEERKKKSANKKQKEKAKDKAAFEEWCQKALAESSHLVDGISPEKRLKMPYEFTNYEFTGALFAGERARLPLSVFARLTSQTLSTGPLRPAYVTKQVTVPEGIPKPDYVSAMAT